MNKEVIFITGVTGFIGRRLVSSILESFPQSQINCLLRDVNKLGELNGRVNVIEASLSDDHLYRKALLEADYVFHIAANASLTNKNDCLETNILGTRKILNILKESTKLKRFIFTSSTGAVDRHPSDPCLCPLTEDCLPYPYTAYGKSKLASEQEIVKSGIPYTIVRLPLVYGEGMRENSHLRVFIEDVKRDKFYTRINFPGRFSPLDVRDAVSMMIALAQDNKAGNELFFVCDPHPVSYGEVFEKIRKSLGKSTVMYNPPPFFVTLFRRYRKILPLKLQSLFNDIWVCSDSKARELGVSTRIPFEQGLDDLIDSLQEKEGVCIVTGAGSGIGMELSRTVAKKHNRMKIILLDIDGDAINNLAKEDKNFLPYEIDLSKVEEIERFLSFLNSHKFLVALLINNAGIGVRGPAMALPLEKTMRVIDVNVKAPVHLMYAVINQMIANNIAGKIVNISSSIAFYPLPLMSVYGASKTFILYLTEALMQEYRDTKLRFYCICPSGTATNFQKSSNVKTFDENKNLLSPVYVAEEIVNLIDKNRSRTMVIGNSGKIMKLLAFFLPRQFQLRLFHRLMADFR